MDKHLPLYRPGTTRPTALKSLLVAILVVTATVFSVGIAFHWRQNTASHVPLNAAQIIQQCQALYVLPGPPSDFHERTQSDRYVVGTPPTLIRNATIWTGGDSGHEVIMGDILIDKGIIKQVGTFQQSVLNTYKDLLVVVDAAGAWVTPGIIDVHSHLGVDSAPALRGSDDTNSLKGLVLPWLRSLDGLNTHDDAYQLTVSGGVTTANILPGSADAIGGQAFTIKLRPTSERSSSAMVLEPPHSLNGTHVDQSRPRWRQMKHACGENPSRVYSNTRMDTIWAFREAYNTARKMKEKQDQYCSKALSGQWKNLGEFPDDLQWEALVDVLRGRVKVHNHCYEAVDLDGMVRLTNEFKFSIAAFHHAHETYLVPDLLKKAYGPTPAIALFATNARYKREAYRGSEFAPRILAENGLRVVMKSDHPVMNSRHLLHDAQQAHYYGLPHNLALSSVISTPANVLGYDHRIGYMKQGYDADVVIWDSHPLSLGAAPKQVYIDGVAQLKKPHVSKKPSDSQKIPKTPNFDQEAKETLEYDGLPPLEPIQSKSDTIVFTNIDSVFTRQGQKIIHAFSSARKGEAGVVVVKSGEIICIGASLDCTHAHTDSDADVFDLEGGSISPALISFGSRLGLNHIDAEPSTNDGSVHDPLKSDWPSLLGEGSIIRAVDGLQFSTRDALLAYRSGVTVGVTAPSSSGFLDGLGTAFNTGSSHRLATGAVVQDFTALHISIDSTKPSVSTQIAALRRLLNGGGEGELKDLFADVVKGNLPLVIQVQSADTMASLINLKFETEKIHGHSIHITFVGANEAHLLAKEIGNACVGVVLRPSRPFPATWKSKRILPGPPLTRDSSIMALVEHNVTVAVGVEEQWASRNLRFDVAWSALEADGRLSPQDAIALASTNLESLLGVRVPNLDLVAVKGGSLLDFKGKVVGLISPGRGLVDLVG
uniref:Amidohydrolase-related domain-containing protein n=1 Tax=Psilocybe cubensis TaxID=181762 RepID=A0A8H8CNE4_PSICU